MDKLHLRVVLAVTIVLLCQWTPSVRGQDYVDVPEGAASLAFVFDITGSMYDDLIQVIDGARKILRTTLSRREKPLYNYVLVPFHDPEVGPVTVTTDPEDFQAELRNLYVQGGGDCPEMSITAIKEAIDICLPNSFIYVFTDARSKDFYLTEEVLALIQKKQSQVVFVLTGDCDDPGHPGYLAYEAIASTSSGQVFLLKKSQVNQVLNFVRVAVQSRKVNLMSVDVPESGKTEYYVPIDSKLQEFTISVSGLYPNINVYDSNDLEISGMKKLLDIRNALVVNVKNPVPGLLRLVVTSDSKHSIRVTGLSTADFLAGFSTKPLDDLKETNHRPISGVNTFMLVNTTDMELPGAFTTLELLGLGGKSLGEHPMIRDNDYPSLYSIPPFVPPEEFFYVKVRGTDDKGYEIQRLTPTAVSRIVPGKPSPYMPDVTNGYFGSTATLVCRINSLVPYNVSWFKEDVAIGNVQYFTESGNATLDIPSANQYSEGIYFCNAENVAGGRRIATFLDISEPPPHITVPQNASVLPGDDALLTCNVFSTVDYNITWHRTGYRYALRSSQKYVDFKNGSLLVRNVQLDDEGLYSCQAANEGGRRKEATYILVQVAPIPFIEPSESSFKTGDSRELVCKAEGYPEPEIIWLRAGQLLAANEKFRIKGRRLTILNMEKEDGGLYTCIARNPAGESSTEASLNYIEPPKITSYESRTLVAAGDEANLYCGAVGIPQPEIRWYKGEVELKALSYVQISDSGSMRIIGTQDLDAGEYRCEATNEAGSDSAILLLEVGSEPQIVLRPQNVGVDINRDTTLECRAQGLPVPKLFWKRKDGRKLDLGGKVTQMSSGAIRITGAQKEDEGSYVCFAQNQFGTAEAEAYVTITGIGSYVCFAQKQFSTGEAEAYVTITGIEAPIIGYMDPVIEVNQGENLELNCQVMIGNPPPKLQWIQYGALVQPDDYVVTNRDGVLIFEDIQGRAPTTPPPNPPVHAVFQDTHSGDYICLASNVGGNASFVVTVEVKVPPSFDFSGIDAEKINFEIKEGDRVVLPCEVDGDPRPMITWFKDESPISLTDYHYYIREDGSLEIYSAEATDTGSYRCQAINVAGEIEKTVGLFVQVRPSISGDPNEEYIVIENETISLPCAPEGIPSPEITWRKNFVPFLPESDRYVFGDLGLTIRDTQVDDKAIYECVASNVAGAASKVITLFVHVPPVILGVGPESQTVLKGEAVTLNCENYGVPTPTVEWKKDEVDIYLFTEETGYDLKEDGSLVISSANVFQTGNYVCIVKNDAGVNTRDLSLVVHDPPSIPANLTTFKDIIERNNVILRCPATGTPPPLITWYKDGSLITGDLTGVVILEDGSLQITEADDDDTAAYKCIAENVAGKVEHKVDLKVYIGPHPTGEDGSQTGVIPNPKVVVTNNASLVCAVDSDPPPTITWLKNGYELIPEQLDDRLEISEDGRVLTISESEVTDTARYTCIAENIAGEIELSFDLDVQVPPSIDQDSVSPPNNTVIKGSSLYLDCPVTGIPRPAVTWYKNGEKINTDLDTNIKLIADGLRLEIKAARVSDTGQYKCVGENVAGGTKEEFNVDVYVKPTVDKPGEINKEEIVTNGTVSLTCPVSGIPLPEITWYKNNRPITVDTEEYKFKDDGWTLEIVSARVADTARYTCRAKNYAGESKKDFELNVLVPPKIKKDDLDLNPKVMINQTTVINCQVTGIPSPAITWFKNGIQLDASVQTRYEILSSGRQLKVRNAQLTDTAKFKCVAVNKAGSDELDFNLFVTVPTKIRTYGVNTNPKVVSQGSLTLTCTVTGVPLPEIVWLKNGDQIIADEIPNISINNQGTELVIGDAEVKDTALYTCRATNEAGDATLSYNVNVQVPPEIDQLELKPDLNVIEGNSIVLNCPATGVPPPEISWLKEGQPIVFGDEPQYELQANGKRLVIESAQVRDKGIYTCVAANEAGSVDQQYDLDVWVKPEIDGNDLDRNPTVIKGHTTELFCPVNGNPFPDIIWLKDGEPVPLDDRVEILSDGQQLKIMNATVTDTGTYKCVARNTAGQDAISFDLEVHVPPSIDESNVVYYRRVIENRTIIIECPVSGIPTPEVSWRINGHPLMSGTDILFTHNNYHLEIPRAKTTDSAVYTCVAVNAAGGLKKNFNLDVQVPPRINKTEVETTVSVIQNQTLVLTCSVYAKPKAEILWLKDELLHLDWTNVTFDLTEGQRLTVYQVQTRDAGTYSCDASNTAGYDRLDYTVNVLVPPEVAGSQFVTTVPVVEGNSQTLECEATGLPTPTLTWLKDSDNIELSENPNIKISEDGRQLQLSSTEVTDTAMYTCHAENQAGISVRTFDVRVQVPANIPGLTGLQDVEVVINEQLILDCPAQGIPPPKISWIRQGQKIQQYSNPSIRLLDNGKRLMIASAQLLDLGDYRCFVENVAGNSSVDYFVSIQVPPTINDGPTQIESVVNTGATLLCESLGLPDPVITWTKDGEPFPNTGLRHNMRESGTIEFTSVRLEDAGTYECNASNAAGRASREMQLLVQVPPQMVNRRPLYLKVVKGEGIELPCAVTGTPRPRILWQKGAKSLKTRPGIQVLESGSLFLKRASRSDNGVYICIAQNSAGTAFGQIRLSVLIPPNVQIRQKDFTVNSAENIVLPCRAQGRPRPTITWKKDGVPLTSSNLFQRVLRNGLAIPYVRPEDAGIYTCTATNSAGNKSEDMNLTVLVKPQIGEASRLLTFTVGEEGVIECAAVGIPAPKIMWLREGRAVDYTTNKYSLTAFGTLIIRDLTEDDTGTYVCNATNDAGSAYQERLLRIQVPPSFIVVPQVQEVLLNSRLELRCTANGIPTPTIHWKKDDSPIQAPLSVNGRSLYIVPNVRSEDGGVYTCIAQNPAGEAETSTMVTVKVPPEILTPPSNKAVTIAERVILPCSVGGDPRPEVIWMKNDRPVELSDRIQQLTNGSLVIYRSTSADAGEYKCVATNDAGTSEGVAMLTIREPPSFLVEPQHTRVDQGDTAVVDCVGYGEPEPSVDWMIGAEPLQDQGRLSVLPNSSLRIIAAQLSDSGTYRCLISNNLGQTYKEIDITVVVHGQWSDWVNWEPCSVTCGKGIQYRNRACNNPEPANDGHGCEGRPVESRSCRERNCPVDGNWGGWLPWEPCSVSCDAGMRTRRRLCDNPRQQFGGTTCVGDGVEQDSCNLTPCAVDGNWGSWTDWQQCSTTCGKGIQERTRECDSPPPQNRGQFCADSGVDKQTCKLRECPVDGNWGNWGHWTPCSLSCGGGSRTRQRLCNNPAPNYGGLFCMGTDTQVDYCNNEPCPIHGGWSQWGSYGACSVSCNGGVKRRYRTCSSPQPSNNGQPCRGSSEKAETCNQVPCPVDGRWSDWSRWSECSRTCDSGTKQRVRLCREAVYGGQPCVGDRKQVSECLLEPCYTIPIVAEGNLVGYINNVDIPAGTFTADMIPLPDQTATHVNATIRGIPRLLVPHFRHLISVLSPLYWTTAMEINEAYNGYSLTNGEFTREVQVEYATGEVLKMSQYAKGVDGEGKLLLDVVVRGKVPEIAESKVVKVTPYWEQYLQTGPGNVHAHSTRMFHVSGYMLPYAWNHSITYESVDVKMPYLVQRLYARNMDIKTNPEKEIVLFKLDTSIAPGSPSNQCPRGFSLNQEGPYCQDDDECARLRPCSDFCHNTPGSFACSCPTGYSLDIDGRSCIDVNECSSASAGCQGDEECINTIGSYKCEIRCRSGFRRSANGKRCIDINECEETPGVCSQICVNRKGGYRCRCRSGYRRLSRGRCFDINECDLSSSPCEQVCANAPGSYLCSCKQGYKLVSGGRCRDINECEEGSSNCGPDQNCVNALGSYRCITVCPKGSRLAYGKCVDIDECETGKHRCYYNQRCVNTDPGYKCLCPRGYRSTGPGHPCLDIDECRESPAVCTYKCVNTYGDFECVCAPGQVRLGDKKSCADIDECRDDPGICQHNCTNTIGSYECTCPPGYRVSMKGNICEDINECVEMAINCGEEKMCFNTLGEFTCIDIPCPKDYRRDPVTNYCVLECIDAEIACPENARHADVIEFRTLALPYGIHQYEDLIRLVAYNQNDEILRKTNFTILENDKNLAFQIRLEDGIGIVFTARPLEQLQIYKVKVRAKSYDNRAVNIQYQTTFIIHIAVSAYPY